MPDVFISYASKDKDTAGAVCASLESKGVSCWIAFRDGEGKYSATITKAIKESSGLVLVLTSSSNRSNNVLTELDTAFQNSIPIIVLRIEDVKPSGGLEYYTRLFHWLDAFTRPIDEDFGGLADDILKQLGMRDGTKRVGDAKSGEQHSDSIDAAHLDKRGLAEFEKGNYDLAIKDFSKAIKIAPENADFYIHRAQAYWGIGDYDKAIKDCTKVLGFAPRNAAAYYYRGMAYYKKADYDKAIQNFDQATNINPSYAAYYNDRSRAQRHKGNLDQAIADCLKAIEIDPKYAAAFCNCGWIYFEKEQYQTAIGYLTKAIRIEPQYTEAFNRRGLAYLNLGDFDQAIEDFNAALKVNPDFNLAYKNRKSAYAKREEHKQQRHKDISKKIAQNEPNSKRRILIVVGYLIMPQVHDMLPALKLKDEINMKGDPYNSEFACIVNDAGLIEERDYMEFPIISVGGPAVNKITASMIDDLSLDPISTEDMRVHHNIKGCIKKAALWGAESAATARAVEIFISSGLLDKFLKLTWGVDGNRPSSP